MDLTRKASDGQKVEKPILIPYLVHISSTNLCAVDWALQYVIVQNQLKESQHVSVYRG